MLPGWAIVTPSRREHIERVAELAGRIPALHDAVAPADERHDAVRLVYLDTLKDAWPD